MARLTRVHQKVFASNASNNGVFGSLQAGNPTTSNDVATLQSLSAFENGWDDAAYSGDKLPPLEEFQGVQYGISYQQAYMLQEGIAEWESSTPYYKGSLAKTISGSSFKLYCSLADNNVNNAVSNTTYWKLVMDSDDTYAFDNTVVHLAGTETITGAKTFGTNITVKMNKPKIFCDDDDETWATDPTTDGNAGGYEVRGSDGNWGALFRATKYTNGNRTAGIQLRGKDMSSLGSFEILVTSDGSSAASATSGVRESITEWGMPDYTSVTAITSGYTAPKNGFYLFSFPLRAVGSFTIGSFTQSFDYNYNNTQPTWCCFPVKKGQAVTFSGCTVYFAQSNGG